MWLFQIRLIMKTNLFLFISSFIIFLLGEKYIGQIGTYEKALSWNKVIEKIPYYVMLSFFIVLINVLVDNKDKKNR